MKLATNFSIENRTRVYHMKCMLTGSRCIRSLLIALAGALLFFIPSRGVSQDGTPSFSQTDRVFGVRCPPGMCRISEGFLLGQRDKAFSMHFIDDEKGWIVGDRGLFLMTEDSGATWQRIFISDETFKDVYFFGQRGWIVGDRGLILHTEDAGKSWLKQVTNVSASLMRISFPSPTKGYVIGADWTLLKSKDRGSSWEAVDFDWLSLIPEDLMSRGVISVNLYDISFPSEDSGWVVGDYGAVLHTSDGGNTWSVQRLGSFPALFSVCFVSDSQGWAVGQSGCFLRTKDGGNTWESGGFHTEESLFKVCMRGDYGAIVGDHATMLVSLDRGKTWIRNDDLDLDPPLPWLLDAWIFPSNGFAEVMSAGEGRILMTKIAPVTKGGAEW